MLRAPWRTAAYTWTGALTLRNVQRPRLCSSTPATFPAASLVLVVSSTSPPGGGRRYPRCQVDRRPEPVAGAFHGRSGVHAHPHQGKAVLGAHVVDNVQPELDRRGWVAGSEHQRIPDGLDLLGLVGSQHLAHGGAEPADQVGGLLVPWASVRAVKPERSANTNVWAVTSDR
jgi:hypothetical protein